MILSWQARFWLAKKEQILSIPCPRLQIPRPSMAGAESKESCPFQHAQNRRLKQGAQTGPRKRPRNAFFLALLEPWET